MSGWLRAEQGTMLDALDAQAPKFLLRDEGVTRATWDREAAGVTFERR